jgi:serine/threonine protein kinase
MSPAPEDDERTIVSPSSGKGGRREAGVQLGHTLPIGTRIRDYEITGLIGEGGFGIVYLAYDHSLQRHVAVKEYMPSSMASRVAGSATIVVKSDRHQETFKAGLKSFVNEARLLARFDHPALVKVYRFWEENGTAYMVMPYYEGPTLKSALAARAQVPDEAALRAWLRPLLDALGVMHAAQCYHRDIAPDNILLTPTGPLLLDFGAARRVIGDMTHALTVVLKPGYAPIEQYGDVASMTQGAWTDLYALACVVYFAVTGKVPMSSVERLMDDRLEPLSEVAAGRYSPGFLRAIDAALAVRPQDRPQTDAQFRALLGEPEAAPAAAPAFRPAPAPAPDDVPTRIVTAPRTKPPSPGTPGPLGAPPGRTAPSDLTAPPARPHAVEPAHEPTAIERRTARPGALSTAPGSLPSAPGGLQTEAWRSELARGDDAPATLPSALPAARVRAAAKPATSRTPIVVAGAVVCLIALAAAGLRILEQRSAATPQASDLSSAPPASPTTSTTAPSVAVPVPTAVPASVPPALPPIVETPATIEAPTPSSTQPPLASPEAPPAKTEPATSPATEPPSESNPPQTRTKRDTPVRTEPVPRPTPAPLPKPAPTHSTGVQARCSDILQKASLEPLSAEEAAFLKRECR